MATWIKCTDTKQEPVYVNLDNAVTVTRNDAAEKVTERGTVISFMGGRFHSERALAVEREGKRLPPANLLLIAENSMAMAARYQPEVAPGRQYASPAIRTSPQRLDCVAGHVRFEPANPPASYLIGIAWQLRLRAAQ